MTPERRIEELGIELPDFGETGYYGGNFGTMKPFHIEGTVLHLSGHVPWKPEGGLLHPGRLGSAVTIPQGYEAARLTAINALAGARHALGSLSCIRSVIKSLNFVACEPDFTDIHKVSSGLSDLLVEVFGEEIGLGGRATIGVQTLADNICFETWIQFSIRDS
ncbi:MAG: RidA family protein [Rhodospirillaceae bacterium]|jgi:enamine deaminase RidA (YjgF/YER057c/UK114 family)|nr:RidA family protein [Rhodospirillaceae bacterium]